MFTVCSTKKFWNWLTGQEPYPSAVEAILIAGELCGMEKLMWGSDYPRTMTAITYRMTQDFVTKSSRLSETEKRMFLGETAEKFSSLIARLCSVAFLSVRKEVKQ